jgi:cytochrome P450
MRKVHRYAFDPSYRLEPTPLYAKLRSEEPVARVKVPHGDEGWLVTRHESVKKVLADPRLSRAAVVAAGERAPRVGVLPLRVNPMSAVDPPELARRRKFVVGALTRHRAEAYRPRTHEIANELIDDMITAGPPADFIDAFATRLPVMVSGEVLGVPRSERIQFRDCTVPLMSQANYTKQEIDAIYDRLRRYIRSLAAHRREQPEDDLLSTLVQAQADERLSEDEVVNTTISLLVNDAVANQLGSCLYLLLTHSDQLAWLREHMSELPTAVEELLRFAPLAPDTPVGGQGHIRMAMENIEIEGVLISAGEYILPSIISANRDERVFADADKLDLNRSPNRHIAFGHGPHRCPGEKLGRMEIQVAMEVLLTRFPELRLAIPVDQVPWKMDMASRGPEKMPVAW